MIKLIATDIDGTLLKDGTLMIDPEYMTVIEKLTSKGIIFVACSRPGNSSVNENFSLPFAISFSISRTAAR